MWSPRNVEFRTAKYLRAPLDSFLTRSMLLILHMQPTIICDIAGIDEDALLQHLSHIFVHPILYSNGYCDCRKYIVIR